MAEVNTSGMTRSLSVSSPTYFLRKALSRKREEFLFFASGSAMMEAQKIATASL
jgi:hypothetical protein